MAHVKEIKEIIEQGELGPAKSALEDLLFLGPKNLEALKLKAQICRYEGRYEEQYELWIKISELDPEDAEAILFFQRKFIDDRENYYFTKEFIEGGRRFLASPRSVVPIGFAGLMGCVLFLLIPKLSLAYPDLGKPQNLLISFAVLIVAPWLLLILTYCRSLRWIDVNRDGITLITRLRKHTFRWDEIKHIHICHSTNQDQYASIIIHPNQSTRSSVLIDLSDQHSAVKARPHLVHEIRKRFSPIQFCAIETYPDQHNDLISF